MNNHTDVDDPLVTHLQKLSDGQDRAALAALRRSLQQDHALDGLRVVLPFLGRAPTRRDEDDALLLAGLFALHPESGGLSVAAALRILAVRSEGSKSVELRFVALLNAERDDLGRHLRHAVSLARANDLALDWHNLRRAIRGWDRDDRARRAWSRDFWASDSDRTDTTP